MLSSSAATSGQPARRGFVNCMVSGMNMPSGAIGNLRDGRRQLQVVRGHPTLHLISVWWTILLGSRFRLSWDITAKQLRLFIWVAKNFQ